MWKCPFNEGDLVIRKDRSRPWSWLTDASATTASPVFIDGAGDEPVIFVNLIHRPTKGYAVAMGRFLVKGVLCRGQVQAFEAVNETR